MLLKKKLDSPIIQKINKIFKDVLDNEKIQVYRHSTSAHIPEWDSLGHIQLIIAIEKYFDIKFTSFEINQYKNVGEMCDAIEKKIKKNEKRG